MSDRNAAAKLIAMKQKPKIKKTAQKRVNVFVLMLIHSPMATVIIVNPMDLVFALMGNLQFEFRTLQKSAERWKSHKLQIQ